MFREEPSLPIAEVSGICGGGDIGKCIYLLNTYFAELLPIIWARYFTVLETSPNKTNGFCPHGAVCLVGETDGKQRNTECSAGVYVL